jgi:hypothetical protein
MNQDGSRDETFCEIDIEIFNNPVDYKDYKELKAIKRKLESQE